MRKGIALALLVLAPPSAQAGSFAVRAAQLDLGDGRFVENGILLIQDGKIAAAGANVDVPPEVPTIEHDGFLTPGMIAFGCSEGAAGETYDLSRSFLGAARSAEMFNPSHSDFRRARAAGITAIVLTPRAEAVSPGHTAVIKTAGRTVLLEDAHVALNLSARALSRIRAPTSYSGLVQELDDRIGSEQGELSEVRGGAKPVWIEAIEPHEIERALELSSRHGLRGVMEVGPLAGELADSIRSSGLGLAIGAVELGRERRSLAGIAELAKASIPLCFSAQTPERHPEELRSGAALCVRAGLDPATAWAALTSTAADLAGVGQRVGRLAPGKDADFVLWSGHPLDLSSVPKGVFIEGVSAADPAEKGKP